MGPSGGEAVREAAALAIAAAAGCGPRPHLLLVRAANSIFLACEGSWS